MESNTWKVSTLISWWGDKEEGEPRQTTKKVDLMGRLGALDSESLTKINMYK